MSKSVQHRVHKYFSLASPLKVPKVVLTSLASMLVNSRDAYHSSKGCDTAFAVVDAHIRSLGVGVDVAQCGDSASDVSDIRLLTGHSLREVSYLYTVNRGPMLSIPVSDGTSVYLRSLYMVPGLVMAITVPHRIPSKDTEATYHWMYVEYELNEKEASQNSPYLFPGMPFICA